MEEIKLVLENLNSALYLMRDGIARTKEKEKELDAGLSKLDGQAKAQGEKARELDARESNVKHIESIVEAQKAAIKLREEAGVLMADVEQKREKLEADLKALAKAKADFEKEKADIKEAEKKQVKAIQEERAELERQKKEFAIQQKVAKELG